ncbi:hypothetical protein GN244_ATG06945 [Phytophthora infestans]|uniref:Uncharacterized protein n=1 Tax=Phytophthora infestans TaxID=4787 RepID=A0A833S5B3_PHYIN|nr:hypothetical protein GN244_ATG06945 [Phytophthora infestans]
MRGQDKAEYVTYKIVTTAGTDAVATDTADVKIRKFCSGDTREWLKWSFKFRNLAKTKGWPDEQKAANLAFLIEGDLAAEVEQFKAEAVKEKKSFETFYSNTVHKLAARVKENIRLFAELPVDAEEIPEVQQLRCFKRGMPMEWQEKYAASGVVCGKFCDQVIYFERLERSEKHRLDRERSRQKKSDDSHNERHAKSSHEKSSSEHRPSSDQQSK